MDDFNSCFIPLVSNVQSFCLLSFMVSAVFFNVRNIAYNHAQT